MSAQLPLLVDSHAHLDGGQYANDRDETIQRAHENGISHILTIGCDLESSAASVALASKHENLYAAVGVHPHDATEINDKSLQQLQQLLARPKVVALGEIGLDFFRDRSPRDIQRNAFRQQIRLAREVGKPIIVHDRDAHDEVLQILEEENAAEIGGVLHCFSGDVSMAKKCLEMGFYLSFPGTITYPKNDAAREVVKAVPIDRMLVETDCPYLSPQKFRGKRNEPVARGGQPTNTLVIRMLDAATGRVVWTGTVSGFDIGGVDPRDRLVERRGAVGVVTVGQHHDGTIGP